MFDNRWYRAVRKTTVALLVLGAAVLASYFVLAAMSSLATPPTSVAA